MKYLWSIILIDVEKPLVGRYLLWVLISRVLMEIIEEIIYMVPIK